MKDILRKTTVILILMMILLNSSLLILISSAVDVAQEVIDESKVNVLHETNLEKYVNYAVGEDKVTLVQMNLKTGVEFGEGQNYYPIEKTDIVLNLPKIEGEYPNKVEVIGISTKATNGNEDAKDIKNVYNNKTGEIKIETTNSINEEGNRYSEQVNGARDEYKIILYYSSQVFTARNIARQLEVKGTVQASFAKGKSKVAEINEVYNVTENISGLISTDVIVNDIYNGAIKANNENGASQRTEYTENVTINPSYRNLSNEVEIHLRNSFIDENNIETELNDIIYKSTKIDKNKVLSQLGEDGYLQILNENGDVLGEVNKDTETSENGIVEINYENEISNIIIKTSQIKELKGITIQNVRQIKENVVNEDIHKIQTKGEISCSNPEEEIYHFNSNSVAEIKDAETRIDVSVDKTELTNNVQNDVVFTADLITNNIQYNLFKNPVLEIKLPTEVEKVVLGEVSLLYDDNLIVSSAEVIDRENYKVIRLQIEGTQNTYMLDSAISGAHIVIPATVIVKKDIEAIDTNIDVTYFNESGLNNDYTNRQLESKKIPISISSTFEVKERMATFASNARTVGNNSELQLVAYAQVGDQVLKDGDTVKEHEVIRYVMQIKNNSNNDISGLKVLAQVPEGTNYATVDRGTYYAEAYDYIEDATKRTIEEDDISIKSGEVIEKYYEVVVQPLGNNQTQRNIANNIQLLLNQQQYANLTLGNVIEKANMKTELKSYIGRDKENSFFYEMDLYNLTNTDINNIYVETSEFQKEMVYNLENFVCEVYQNNDGFLSTAAPITDKKYENNKLSFKVGSIKANQYLVVRFNLITENFDKDIIEQNVKLSYTATINNNEIYRSNENIRPVYPECVTVSMESEKEGEELEYGEEIDYVITVRNEGKIRTDVQVTDFLPEDLKGISVEYDKYVIKDENDIGTIYDLDAEQNLECDREKVLIDLTNKVESVANLNYMGVIPAGKTITFNVKATAGDVDSRTEVTNFATASGAKFDTKVSNKIKSYVVPKEVYNPDDPDDPNDPNNPDDPDDPNDPNNPDTPNDPDNPDVKEKYSISGIVWEDKNEDGKRDSSEKLLSNINVKLFDINTNIMNDGNAVQTVMTNEKGEYTFSEIPIGKYIVIFEYDTNNYKITTYQKTAISEKANSDVINKDVNINGTQKLVGITDTLVLQSKNLENIDMGLVKNGKFDFKIDKYVSKITVSNSKGTKEYTYNNSKLAKVEIDRKQIENTTINVEYSIVITNDGELDGYVNEILDNKPEALSFSNSGNEEWKVASTNNLKNTSLTGTKIAPGESKTVKLVLTKKMTNSSAGTVKNTVQLSSVTNLDNIEDMDKTNNTSEASVIISVKTGLVKGISIGMIIIVLAVILAYCIKNKKIKSLMVIVFGLTIILSNITVYALDYDITIKITGGNKKDGFVYTGSDGKTYTCEHPGWGQCGNKIHYYKKNEEKSQAGSSITEEGPFARNGTEINFEKVDSTIKPSKLNSNYNKVGPYKMQNNLGGTVSLEVKGKTSIDGNEKKISATMIDSNGNEISNSIQGNSTTEFYLKVSKNVKVVTNVKATLTVPESLYYKVTTKTYFYYECVGVEGGSHGGHQCSDPKVTQPMSRTEISNTERYEDGSKEIEWPDDIKITGDLKITKVDYDTEKAIPGVTFKITGDDVDLTVKTDEKGIAKLEDILPGKYTVEEIGLPDGYDLELQTDTLHKNVEIKAGQTTKLKIKNRKYGNLKIIKVDKDTQKSNLEELKFKGVKFRISYTDKNKEIQYITSYTEGKPSKLTVSEDKNKAYLFETNEEAIVELKNIPQYYTYHVEEVDLPGEMAQYYDVSTENLDVKLENNVGSKETEVKYNNPQKYVDLEGYVWEDIASEKLPSRDNLWTENDADIRIPNIPVYLKKNGEVIAIRKTDENGSYYFPAKGDREVDDNNYDTYDYTINIEEASQYSVEFEYNGLKYQSVETNLQQDTGSKASDTIRDEINKNFSTIYGATPKNNNGSSTGTTSAGVGLTYTGIGENKDNPDKSYYSELVQNTQHTKESLEGSIDNIEAGKMLADTEEAGYKVKWSAGVKTVKNINLGICKRAQPNMAIATDLNNLQLGINGYNHTYYYKEIEDYIESEIRNNAYDALMDNGFTVQAKRNGKYRDLTYVREIYDSYIAYTKEQMDIESGKLPEKAPHGKLQIFSTYTIIVKNQTGDLISQVGLRNYADERYSNIVSATIVRANGENEDITSRWKKGDTTEDANGNKVIIWETDGILNEEIQPGESMRIEVKYELDPSAIVEMATEEVKLIQHTTEITSYSTWTKDNTGEKQPYGGIDENSAPNNIDFKNIDTHEDDTKVAPGLKLIRNENDKQIEGMVFEDSIEGNYKRDDLMTGGQRIGNKQYDDGENAVKDAKVELKSYNEENHPIVTLYTLADDGEVVTTPANAMTGENGKYSFVGIVPGEYYLEYTYGKFEDKQTMIGDTPVTTENYKSTIVDSGTFKDLLKDINDGNPLKGIDMNENSVYWYDNIINNPGVGRERASSAVDDSVKRGDISTYLTTLNYRNKTAYQEEFKNVDTDKTNLLYMNAYSGVMSFAIENKNEEKTYNTEEDIGKVTGPRNYQVKFGIIERPRQSLQVTKEISNMSLTLANGHVLAQGDPRNNDTMNYVTYPDGNRLKIEVDSELIQGSNLELTYEIKVYNRSELDYNTTNYYRYGDTDGKDPIDLSYVIADYADENLTFNDYIDERVKNLVSDYDGNGMTGKGKWQLLGKDWSSSGESNLAGIPIWDQVYGSVKTRNNILIAEGNNNMSEEKINSIKPGDVSTLHLIGKKLLSSMTDKDTLFDNHVELIQVTNPIGRFYGNTYNNEGKVNRIANSKGKWNDETPGNYNLTKVGEDTDFMDEGDNNYYVRAQTTIVPPLGDNKNIAIYITVGFGSLLILAGGIILIKKKVL